MNYTGFIGSSSEHKVSETRIKINVSFLMPSFPLSPASLHLTPPLMLLLLWHLCAHKAQRHESKTQVWLPNRSGSTVGPTVSAAILPEMLLYYCESTKFLSK